MDHVDDKKTNPRAHRMTPAARAFPLIFSPRLPPELFRPILQFIHPSEFDYRLCLVSHAFRVDVEAQFYKYVAVPERRLLFFCRTMTARPDLARRVQSLAFTEAVHRKPEQGDKDVVAQMMKLLVNLKDLSISESIYLTETGEPWPVEHIDMRILQGCPFKLERLACIFKWDQPLAQWLATQPQLAAFEHGGFKDDRETVRLAPPRDPTLLRCAYLRISPYILACFDGREEKPQPVALRFDIRFNTVQEEFAAARALRDVCRNLKCLTLMRQIATGSVEFLSTSRILRTFADRAPNLTCLAIYENIDYSAGENKRILRIIKEHFAKLQVFIWAPFKFGGQDDEDEGMSSDSSGFSIGSCTEEEEFSLDKTELYARAMFDAVPAMRMFISFRKGLCHVWRRAPAPGEPEPRGFKRAWLSICPSEDTFRVVDPDHPMDFYVKNVPHGPPLAEPRIMRVYNAPIRLPVSRSKTCQNL